MPKSKTAKTSKTVKKTVATKVASKNSPVKPSASAKATKPSSSKATPAKASMQARTPKETPRPQPVEEDIAVEVVEIQETAVELEVSMSEEDASDEDVILTDAEGNRYCRVRDCDQIAAVDGYCRFHYLLLWKKIQVRKKILTDGKLEYYVVELTSRYPDKFLEMIRKDLRTQKDFLAAIQELEIDESGLDNDYDDEEDTQSFIDEVRGTGITESDSVGDEF